VCAASALMVSYQKSGCDSAEPWRDLPKSWQTPA
jgi:rubredoxin